MKCFLYYADAQDRPAKLGCNQLTPRQFPTGLPKTLTGAHPVLGANFTKMTQLLGLVIREILSNLEKYYLTHLFIQGIQRFLGESAINPLDQATV